MGMRIVVTDADQVFVFKEPYTMGIDEPINCGGSWEEFFIERRWGQTTEKWLINMGAKPATFKAPKIEDLL